MTEIPSSENGGVSDDGLVITLNLRDDIVWSDGTPITSADFKFTYDMIMDPGIDGLETYQKILQIRPGQRTIIASGYSESERVREAQRIGAGTYIKKPYLIEKFGRAVKAELRV